jgi:hypothetical protein
LKKRRKDKERKKSFNVFATPSLDEGVHWFYERGRVSAFDKTTQSPNGMQCCSCDQEQSAV